MVAALCIMPFAFAQYPLLLLPWILAQYGLIPHRMRFFTLVLGFFQLFHIHMRIRLRSHLSMLASDVFASAYLKYDTHPRMTWCSTIFLRSYPIPLLQPVSTLSFAFSLNRLLGWTPNLQPSPVL